MSEGRKTKSGAHYNYVDRRKAAQRSLKVGTAQAAKEYSVSEASIKGWRKMYGLDTEAGYGGQMDRYFCQRCAHGCGNRSTFTGCSYLLHTGEKRPHKNGWCLGFEPREGVRQSTVERYEKETKRHEEESEEDDDVGKIEPMDIDAEIISKASKHLIGVRYTEEERQRVLDVCDMHSLKEAALYFDISKDTIKYWRKRRMPTNTAKKPKIYKKLTEDDLPELPAEVVQVAAETAENADDKQRNIWDEYIAEQIKAHIAMLEGQAERYRRMLRILEGEA